VFVVQWDERIVRKTCANTKRTLSVYTLEGFISNATTLHLQLCDPARYSYLEEEGA